MSGSDKVISSPSVSGNVALYPSLARDGEVIGCAWYEHSSPEKPDRSDVWFAMTHDARQWTVPFNVSGGVSYNNGPTLTHHPGGGFLCAWHSWRPPGLEPFRADGDVCNIWTARIHTDGTVDEALLALPAWSRTEYPALACWQGNLVLVCSEREGGRILVSFSKDGDEWSDPLICPPSPDGTRYQWPSVTVSEDGTCHLTAVSDHGKRLCLFQVGHEEVHQVGTFESPESANQHPKVRGGTDHRLVMTAYSTHWGSFCESYEIEVENSQLCLELSAQGGAGREHWTLNYVDLVNETGDFTRYNFGPFLNVDHGEINVVEVSTDGAVTPDAGVFFDRQVNDLLRELGTPWTRGLVHAKEPATLHIAIPRGHYTMRVAHSSWMASQPSTRIGVVNAGVLRHQSVKPEADSCSIYLLDVDASEIQGVKKVSPPNCNRSSQVLALPGGEQFLLAWVDWNGAHTSIQVHSLAAEEIFELHVG